MCGIQLYVVFNIVQKVANAKYDSNYFYFVNYIIVVIWDRFFTSFMKNVIYKMLLETCSYSWSYI
jgi:hypothetical protein